MQVILLERIGRLGQMGDVVNVKDGFARNFLLPQGKALRATEANRKRFERDKAQLEARDLELKSEAQAVATKLDRKSFIIIRQAGESGQLYGSVSTRDIAAAVTEGGFSIERRQVMLDRPIKTLGLHDIRVALHAEVEPHIARQCRPLCRRGGTPGARRGRDAGHDRGRGGCRSRKSCGSGAVRGGRARRDRRRRGSRGRSGGRLTDAMRALLPVGERTLSTMSTDPTASPEFWFGVVSVHEQCIDSPTAAGNPGLSRGAA